MRQIMDRKNEIGKTENRPWGNFTILDEGNAYKVKRIEVFPGKRLSYQKHARRAEHWFIVSGTARITLDGSELLIPSGGSIDIAVGVAHRVENSDDTQLVFIEIQTGDYFGEDDIVRLEDDFGRVGQN
jgi:mannose-6-phosphate isomerase